jgi:hypothetical protein
LHKKYDKLWVFGDSYTTPNLCVESKESFWGLTAAELKIPIIVNCSRPVNSWTSVQHILVGMSSSINWKNDLIFIGIPPLERITIFDDFKNTEYLGYTINTHDWSTETFDVKSHRGLISLQNYGSDKQLIIHSDRSWLETDVLRQVFLISQWLNHVSANYMILNLSKNFDENNVWGPSDFVLDYCKNLKNSILFCDTYHNINIGVNKPADSDEPHGHHGAVGNAYFFMRSLLPKLKECNLC